MSLSCDCYPGCWGDHAADWPWVAIPHGVGHADLAAKAGVPYGSYVRIGDNLHVVTPAMAAAVRRAAEEITSMRKTAHIDRPLTLAEAYADVSDELGDVQTYLDILAFRCGVNLGNATANKFNRVSDRVGSDVKL